MRGRRRVGISHGRAGSAPRRSGCREDAPHGLPHVAAHRPKWLWSSPPTPPLRRRGGGGGGGRKNGVTALLSRPPPRGSPLPPFTPQPPQYLTPPLTLSWFGRSALSSLRSGRRGCCGGRSALPSGDGAARPAQHGLLTA